MRPVTHAEVVKEIKHLKNDCSTGSDNISTYYIKLISSWISSPLTHIINSHITTNSYPSSWKLSRVVPIPKNQTPVGITEYRPISIQTALSKVFERIVLNQLITFIEHNNIYKDTITGFRKGFSTANALTKFRDDILKCMNSNEVTLAVLIDFSKAFDTISHESFIKKLNNLGFGKDFITWVLSYLSDRKQYIQVDDKKSSICRTYFGVPQGSILGPVLFNLYVNDLQDQITGCSKVLQYADDTTLYVSSKPKSIDEKCVGLNQSLADVKKWSEENNLSVNALKTKFITFSTSQLSKRHDLE